jgi:hypothetical protein
LYTTCLTVLGYWRKTISSAVSLILQAMRAWRINTANTEAHDCI